MMVYVLSKMVDQGSDFVTSEAARQRKDKYSVQYSILSQEKKKFCLATQFFQTTALQNTEILSILSHNILLIY